MPGARCTRSLICKKVKAYERSHREVHRLHPAFPHAMVLTVSLVLFPVIGLCCHRRQRSCLHRLDASVEASEPHHFAVREKRASSSALSRPPHPEPNVRDDRETPLRWAGMAGAINLIWVARKSESFCRKDWTASITVIPLNKIA